MLKQVYFLLRCANKQPAVVDVRVIVQWYTKACSFPVLGPYGHRCSPHLCRVRVPCSSVLTTATGPVCPDQPSLSLNMGK